MSCIWFRCVLLILFGVLFNGYAMADGLLKSQQKSIYEFQLSATATKALLGGIERLRFGDTIAHARVLLGEPSVEKDLLQQPNPLNLLLGKPLRTFSEHVLEYCIKCVTKSYRDNGDQVVTVEFDADGLLQGISYNSMKPIPGAVITFQSIQPAYGIEYYHTKPPMTSVVKKKDTEKPPRSGMDTLGR